MTRKRSVGRAGVATMLVAAFLQGCAGTPRNAPLAGDLVGAGEEAALEGLVAPLTLAAAHTATRPRRDGFPAALRDARPVDVDRLGVGDVLDVLVWESGEGGLFAGEATRLEAAIIDREGRLFVPFVGALPAAGSTIAQLRDRIREALTPMTLMPQVDLRLREPNSRLVTVGGAVARPGVYPIERSTARLAAMLTAAGGPTELVDRLEIVVRRDGAQAAEALSEVLRNPTADIALRPGDQILVDPQRERFVALGATSAQAEVVFPTRDLTLMSALGAVAGLRDFDADPRSVFVMRLEDRAVADALLPGEAPVDVGASELRPILYRADLSSPEGLFAARTFRMRDGDTLIASNAPLAEIRKLIQTFTAVLTPVQQGTSIATQ